MNRKFYLLTLLLCWSGLETFAQTPVWTQLPGSPSGTARNDDIFFTDETNGWTARGTSGIHKTTDGGKTWVQVLTKPSTHFRSIGFLTPMHGFAGNLGVGSYDGNVTDTNVLYESTNGGVEWHVFPGLSEAGMKGFCAFHVLDAQHIYGGGRVRGPAHFVKSENGGTNWTILNLTAAGVMGGIMDVYFKDPTNGFVVGMDTNAYNSCAVPYYHGAIARTTNGGATWEAVANSGVNCSYFWKMSWPSPQVGYASLQQNGASSSLIFFKTTDGGNNWVSNGIPYSQMSVSTFYLQGIGFISPNEGWVGGASSTTPYDNNFLHTTDGGATWEKIGYNDSRSINRIRFYPKFAVASGVKLHIYRVPLLITSQPQSQTNDIGSTVVFDASAQGTAPLNYQWRFNTTNIFGAMTNSYSVTNFQATNAGNYDVVASDYSGSVTSSVAVLSAVGASIAPLITVPPQNQIVFQGSNVTFSVTVSGTEPFTYQWKGNGKVFSDATNSSFVLTNVQPIDGGNYSVTVMNAAGITNSPPALLTVFPTNALLFARDFDDFPTPIMVT
ncbi:MAG: immunoglobulin domain-containing protein, partial [Verrucomicrobiota bacterium]